MTGSLIEGAINKLDDVLRLDETNLRKKSCIRYGFYTPLNLNGTGDAETRGGIYFVNLYRFEETNNINCFFLVTEHVTCRCIVFIVIAMC